MKGRIDLSTTYLEMSAQYEAIEQTYDYAKNRVGIIKRYLSEKAYKTVIFIGSGSSYCVSKSLESIYRNLTGAASMSATAGDIYLNTERYKAPADECLVIAVTRSGSTSELLGAIEKLKAVAQIRVIAITCVDESPIGNMADITLSMPWAFDASICQTRTVSCLYAAGAVIAAGLADRLDAIDEFGMTIGHFKKYADRFEQEFLKLAKERFDNVALLADGEEAGMAEEGALAFKEMAQVHSNQYGLLDARHGPMVLIGKGTLVIASLRSDGEHERKMVEDLIKKNATVVTCTDSPQSINKVYLNAYFGEKLDIIGRAIAVLMICQYTAYYKAVVKGLNPDSPAGLDAWIKL